MSRYTDKQKRTLSRLADGAVVHAYPTAPGDMRHRTCFHSDEDGMRGVLYLTLTMRALLLKGAISFGSDGVCTLTEEGRANVL